MLRFYRGFVRPAVSVGLVLHGVCPAAMSTPEVPSETSLMEFMTFKLEQTCYKILGIKNTHPWEQHQLREGVPPLKCSKCGRTTKIIENTTARRRILHFLEEDKGFRFSEWPTNSIAVPEDLTVLEEECGRFANFFVEWEIFMVETSLSQSVIQIVFSPS